MVVALPWLPDTGRLDLGSRKELEFPGWVWDGDGVTGWSLPVWMLQQPFLEAADLSAAGTTSLSDSVARAASFPKMWKQAR